MQGFPVSSSGSRTALGDSTGCRSQLFSLIAFVFVLIVLLLAHGALSLVPRAALGALVVYAAIKLVNVSEYRRFARFRRSELVLALSTTLAVLGLGVLYGILAAVALSILDLLHRVAHPHDGVLGFVPGVPGMHDIDDYPNASPVPGLVVYRYDAPLCFANAEDFRRRAISAVTTAGGARRMVHTQRRSQRRRRPHRIGCTGAASKRPIRQGNCFCYGTGQARSPRCSGCRRPTAADRRDQNFCDASDGNRRIPCPPWRYQDIACPTSVPIK
ncbi:sulfate ABC transporter [Mycobacteroides abscessus]|nr:sulfate ABC transporter [Mycobacteroides abscessus]CPX69941.1 sulfate ABC transporter [Mycobacteroides abscessus]CPZ76663.1 sulfate ABC transporter [Mycobacteroides abscessus]